MQVQGHNDLLDHNQGEVFEHLSTFIQLFRRSIALSELIATLISKDQDYAPIIEKIKLVFEQLQPLKLKYQDASGCNIIRQTTYHRFTCRLLEILYLYTSKHKEAESSQAFACFQRSLKEIEAAVKQSQQARSLLEVIKITQLSFLKFFMSCKKNAKKADEETEKKCQLTFWQIKKSYLQDRKDHKKKIFKASSLGQQFQSESEESEKTPFPTASLTSFNKASSFNKDLLCIQKRFDLLKGMDVDFSSFRCDYFMAKNSKDSFFRDCLKRNDMNKKLITTYHDDFYLFQKKKTNKENKRNKLKNLYGNIFRHHSGEKTATVRQAAHHSLYDSNNLNFTTDPDFPSLFPTYNPDEQSTIHLADEFEEKSLHTDKSLGKKQLVMKNIQLTLGKGKIKQPKGTQNIFKNSMKPQAISQYYYNELDGSSNNSLDFLHSKLRVEPNRSKYKTEGRDNGGKKECDLSLGSQNEVRKELDPISMAIKSRSTFKGKYLEINCVGKKNESDLKRKIFHNGASITKIGIKNGFKIENNKKVMVSIH